MALQMAFLRLKKVGKNYYKYKVQTYREGGKVKQRQEYFGKATKADIWWWKNFSSFETVKPSKPRIIEKPKKQIDRIKLADKLSSTANEILNSIARLGLGMEKYQFDQYSTMDQAMIKNNINWIMPKLEDFLNSKTTDGKKYIEGEIVNE